MSAFTSVKIDGLDELRASFERLPKDVAAGLGLATFRIEAALKHDIITMYNLGGNRFNNALVGSRYQQRVSRGKSVFENGLEFKNIPIDLAKFPYTSELGNIDTPAGPASSKKHPGQVHSVAVRRGKIKVVYGKYGYGGFTRRNGIYGTQMFERISNSRYPLRLVFGPSIANIVSWGIDHPGMLPTFDKALDEAPQIIADSLKL